MAPVAPLKVRWLLVAGVVLDGADERFKRAAGRIQQLRRGLGRNFTSVDGDGACINAN